jgi:hypothetical protein
MLGCTIGVVATARQTRRQIARALRSSATEPLFLEVADIIPRLRAGKGPDLLIIDGDVGDADSLAQQLQALSSAGTPPPVVILSLNGPRTLTELIHTYEIGNLVAKHGAVRAAYPVLDERELLVTCEKVLRRDIFGIDKYIGSWAIVLQRDVIGSTESLRPALERLERFLSGLDCPERIVPQIVTVAEEFVINAMMHAPHDESGSPKYEHLHPRTAIVLEPREHVELVYGCDGQRLMVSVADNFGRLDFKGLSEHLARDFMTQDAAVEDKPSGAGLGLSLAWSTIHQLVFNVQESVRTEVIAGWYIRGNSVGEFNQVGKSLNLFWLPADNRPIQLPVPQIVQAGARA